MLLEILRLLLGFVVALRVVLLLASLSLLLLMLIILEQKLTFLFIFQILEGADCLLSLDLLLINILAIRAQDHILLPLLLLSLTLEHHLPLLLSLLQLLLVVLVVLSDWELASQLFVGTAVHDLLHLTVLALLSL